MENGGYLIWTQCLLGILTLSCYADNSVIKSISCYDCNSLFDPRCGDPLDPYSLGTVNCTAKRQMYHMYHLKDYPPMLCRKITQKVQGQTRVIRGCGFIPEEKGAKTCYKRTGTHDVHVEYCACNENLCNKGLVSRPSLNLISAGTVLLLTIRAIYFDSFIFYLK